MKQFLKQLRTTSGQTTVEFALAVVALLVPVVMVVQVGLGLYQAETLNSAVNAVARAASTCRFTGTSGIPTLWTNLAGTLPSDKLTSPTGSSWCVQGQSVTVTGQYTLSINLGLISFSLSEPLSSSDTTTVE